MMKNDLDVSQMLYSLRIKNMTGYMESCFFCGDRRCEGCPVPFDNQMTYNDLLEKIGVTSNVSFYQDGYHRGKKDVIIEVVWNIKIDKVFFD